MMRTTQDDTVYLVLEDFGKFGQAYRETDPKQADRKTMMSNLLSGQYERPVRIVAFSTAQGWARDADPNNPDPFDKKTKDKKDASEHNHGGLEKSSAMVSLGRIVSSLSRKIK